jgi:tripartite-type tricarboxylate transporter receptor subunit TctC
LRISGSDSFAIFSSSVPNVLVAKPTFPVSDVAGLQSMAAAAPRQLSYASTDKGGTPHLTMEWLMSAAGFELVHVPYPKGLAPALNDLLGGHVDLMFANLSDARPHVESGKLKALGVGSAEPVSVLPGVPPISRVVPGLLTETWYALAAPGETPPGIVAKIAADVASVLANPVIVERFRALSLTPVGNAPADAAAFVETDAKRWQNVIETIGLKPE